HPLPPAPSPLSLHDALPICGPNVPPPARSAIVGCFADAPGTPIHVLISDREAEHIPGCNMAFRKRALEEVGGFRAEFRIAGDDRSEEHTSELQSRENLVCRL